MVQHVARCSAKGPPGEHEFMKRFFHLTFKPFFVLTGIATTLGALNAFWPRWAVEKLELIPFNQDYTILVQHWGMMLGIVGVFMVIVAFRTDWRKPVLLICTLEKAFFVYLVATNISQPYARGLWAGAAMDACVVLYTLLYFAVNVFQKHDVDGARVSMQV